MVTSLRSQNRKPTYISRLLQSAQLYAKFTGVTISVPHIRQERSLVATLTIDEIQKFLTLPLPAGNSSKRAWRSWMMFWQIMAYTGMRPGEIATLTKQQINLSQKLIHLPVTKTSPRSVPINHVLHEALTEYLPLVENYLFPIKSKRPARKQHIEKPDWCHNFKVRCRIMNLNRPGLKPYSLRHTLITRMLDEDISLFRVQQIVGHRSAKTTEGYYHASGRKTHEAIEKDPLCRGVENPIAFLWKQLQTLNIDITKYRVSMDENRIEIVRL